MTQHLLDPADLHELPPRPDHPAPEVVAPTPANPSTPVARAPTTRRASRRHLLLAPAVAFATAACTQEEADNFLAWVNQQNGNGTPPTTTPPPTTTVPPGAGSTSVTAGMAVNKLTFGPTPGMVAQVEATGVQAWIERQLAPAGLPDAEGLLSGAEYQTLRNTNAQNYAVQNSDGGQEQLFDQMDHATLLRAVKSEHQLYEVMCDFWSNHFNIWRRHTWMGFLKTRDNESVIRPHALGKYRDMLMASSHSPSMLDYLDNLPNDASTPGGVNENYARELMELHTLGIIDGQHVYTEADVHAVATIVSGWSMKWDENAADRFEFYFDRWQHTNQAVSAFGGAFTAPARADRQGLSDGERLMTFLANHPSTAKYIAYKLCRRFIGDNPPANVVDSAAAVFTANDTAIAPTLRHIFSTPEFANSGGRKIRRPLEHLVGCCRALNATVPTDPQGNAANAMRQALEDMGQAIFERVSPDGYPDIAAYWVSSEGLLQRWSVAAKVTRNKLTWWEKADKLVVNLAPLMPNPLPPTVADLVAVLAQRIGNYTMPTADVADLCASISVSATATASTLSTSTSKLPLAVGLVLSHPNFQRR